MSSYEVELTATFSTPQVAGRFASQAEAELGGGVEREGSTVTCFVYRHGDEITLSEMARDMEGTVSTTVLKDRE